MDLGLDGRRALVLGSSAGMGRAVAAGLVAEGTRVVVAGRDMQRTAETAERCGATAWAVGDLAEAGVAERLVGEAVAALGGLDILVGNTGGGRVGGLLDVDDPDLDAGYRAMLRPQLVAARTAAPHLREGGRGRIVFLTARSILEASPELALSSVFRSGVAAAARSLALELAPAVTVNVVVPGQVDTGALARFEAARATQVGESAEALRRAHLAAIPMARLARPEEVADLVVFLASSRAGYITGATVRVDGGLSRGF